MPRGAERGRARSCEAGRARHRRRLTTASIGKPSFVSYVNDRLGGFEPDTEMRRAIHGRARARRLLPGVLRRDPRGRDARATWSAPARDLTGQAATRDRHRQSQGRDRRREASRRRSCRRSRRPASTDWQSNGYYKTEEEYLFAIADAMREEYEAIVDAGLPSADRRSASRHLLHQATRPQRRRMPQVGGGARRRAQSRAARHPAGKSPLPHLLRHQYGSAHPRHGAQGHRRHHLEDPRRRLFLRGRQPAPRA